MTEELTVGFLEGEGEQLSWSIGRGPYTSSRGLGLLLLSLVFVVVGLVMIVMGLGLTPVPVDPDMAIILVCFSAIPMLAGLVMCYLGAAQYRRDRLRQQRFASNPQCAWFGDYAWDPAVAKADWAPLRNLKFGKSQLAFASFPYYLGDMLEATFACKKGIGACDSMTFILRCIREQRDEGRGPYAHSSIKRYYARYVIYRDVWRVDFPDMQDKPRSIQLTFLLPPDAPSTCLTHDPPTYWELVVKADTPGVDFRAEFLVPVYTKPQ